MDTSSANFSPNSTDAAVESQTAAVVESGPADVNSIRAIEISSSQMRPMSFDARTCPTFPECNACGKLIKDRFFLEVIGKHWHEGCLVCSSCRCNLKTSLFEKYGLFFCKDDYHRAFGKRCAKCLLIILTTEFVMKASNKFYHVVCFKCSFCFRRLKPGDRFKMNGTQLICEEDYIDQMAYGISKPLALPSGYVQPLNPMLN